MIKKHADALPPAGAWLSAFLLITVVIVVLLPVTGCGAKKEMIRQREIKPHEGPVTVDILKQSVGFRDIRTVKALTDVRISRNTEPAGSFSGVFGYKAPNSLKTSFFGPFGITVMEFLITENMIQIYVPPQNMLYEMRSPEISFSSLLNTKLRYAVQEDDQTYALLVYDASEVAIVPVTKYLFDRTYLLNRRITVYKEGREVITFDFDDFNGTVPATTRVAFSNGAEMEIVLREPEYDTEIPSEYFSRIQQEDNTVLPLQDLLRRFDPKR